MASSSTTEQPDAPPSTAYDPFARGPHPVGVRTLDVPDPARDGTIRVEVWYPAAATVRGADLDRRRQDRYRIFGVAPRRRQAAVRDAPPADAIGLPLVVFSHGLGSFARQSTFLTTHLASHGYLVVAPDHRGSTLADMASLRRVGVTAVRDVLATAADARLQHVPTLIEAFTTALPAYAGRVDAGRLGIAGHSFGGWTSIGVTSVPTRIGCALALAPIGVGPNPAFGGQDAYGRFDLPWPGRPPTLIIAAERDSICRLPGIERLHAALGAPHRLAVLADTDHVHFCDRAHQSHQAFAFLLGAGRALRVSRTRIVPWRELLAEEPAHDVVRGAGLAHFDAHLKALPAATDFLGRLSDACTTRGAPLTVR